MTNNLVMVGCVGQGGDRAKGARLATIKGTKNANVSLIGCRGPVDRDGALSCVEIGGREAGARFGGRWDSNNLAWVGEYSLWVDDGGHLRIKKGVPKSDNDGKAVGV